MDIIDKRNKQTTTIINLSMGDMFTYDYNNPQVVFIKVRRESINGFVNLMTGELYDATVHQTTYAKTPVIKINDPQLILK